MTLIKPDLMQANEATQSLTRERSRRPGFSALQIGERFGLLFILLAEIAVFAVTEPSTFPTLANFQIIATSVSVLGVAALALMLPLIAGRFDVSVGANLGVCAIVVATMMSRFHLPLAVAVLVAVAVGAGIGLVNGVIVAYFGVNSIIATIGSSTVMAGLVQAYTGGIPISTGLSSTLTDLSNKDAFNIPDMFLILVGVALVCWYLHSQTPYGRHLFATGSNLSAAKLNGLPVRGIVLLSFIGAGALAGVAGVMQVAAQGSGDPSAGGLQFIMPALAAVFLGATTLQPGRYNVAGSILSLIFLSTTISGLVLSGVHPWVTDVFNGSAVIIAIAVSAQVRRRRTGTLEMGT